MLSTDNVSPNDVYEELLLAVQNECIRAFGESVEFNYRPHLLSLSFSEQYRKTEWLHLWKLSGEPISQSSKHNMSILQKAIRKLPQGISCKTVIDHMGDTRNDPDVFHFAVRSESYVVNIKITAEYSAAFFRSVNENGIIHDHTVSFSFRNAADAFCEKLTENYADIIEYAFTKLNPVFPPYVVCSAGVSVNDSLILNYSNDFNMQPLSSNEMVYGFSKCLGKKILNSLEDGQEHFISLHCSAKRNSVYCSLRTKPTKKELRGWT